MKITPRRQFLLTMISFAVLAAAFKVMVLVEGITEVRPANAIPVIAGLAFGPIGALGCGIGNLIGDFFGTLNLTSLLGIAGNMLAAYIPYKMWHYLSDEEPNVHTYKNIFRYGWIALVSALSVAFVLGFGLELFFGIWIKTVYLYVFYNNLGFSLVLGLPLFIVFTSDSVKLEMCRPPRKRKVTGNRKIMTAVLIIYTFTQICSLAAMSAGWHLGNSVVMAVLTAVNVILMILICI